MAMSFCLRSSHPIEKSVGATLASSMESALGKADANHQDRIKRHNFLPSHDNRSD
jgi:hypothetical protein